MELGRSKQDNLSNLIYGQHLATSHDTDVALILNGQKVMPTKGEQKGKELVSVINVLAEAISSTNPLDIKIMKIDLEGIHQNLKQRVDRFKEKQIEALNGYGYTSTQDATFESALQSLTTLIAQKQSIAKPTPIASQQSHSKKYD
jgi:hypothetical protein